jgi:hypothetical protein
MPSAVLREVVQQATSALLERGADTDPLAEKKRLRHVLHVYCYVSSLGTHLHGSHALTTTAHCRRELAAGLTHLCSHLLRATPSTTRDEIDMDNRIKELAYWTLANLTLGAFRNVCASPRLTGVVLRPARRGVKRAGPERGVHGRVRADCTRDQRRRGDTAGR